MPSLAGYRVFADVALRKESVDRNSRAAKFLMMLQSSLSARRAWIEMLNNDLANIELTLSLSARRAWIEIGHRGIEILRFRVALRKESVDRNYWFDL